MSQMDRCGQRAQHNAWHTVTTQILSLAVVATAAVTANDSSHQRGKIHGESTQNVQKSTH